jgi:hypothetical protein
VCGDPGLIPAVVHRQEHWFSIRKLAGEWYNFNSLYPGGWGVAAFFCFF